MVKLWAKLAILIKKRVQDSIIAKIALALSVVIVFCTTYLLILPALTISTGNSSAVFQSQDGSSSQVESTAESSQETNQTENSSQTTSTESSQEKKDMSQAGTLNAETSDITVNVSYEDNTFSEPVQLKVKPVEDTSAIDNKLTTLLSESKQELSQAHSYDISFVTDDGREVEPSKDVKVSMNFKNDLSTSDDKQAGWKLYHFVDNDINQVQDLTESTDTDIKETGDGAVESIDFKSNTFSTYTLAGVTYADFSGYLTGAKCTTTPTYTESTNTLTTDIGLSFGISKQALLANNNYALELPDDAAWPSNLEGKDYPGYDEDDHSLAFDYKFVQQSGKKYIVIKFRKDYINSAGENVTGTLNYTATIGTTERKGDGSYSIKYSDTATVEIPAKEVVPQEDNAQYDVKSEKSGEVKYDGDRAYLKYTVKVSSDKGTKGNITLKDTLSGYGLDDIKIDDIKIDDIKKNNQSLGKDTVNKVNAGNKKSFTITLPKINAKESYEIKYHYRVKQFPAGKPYAIKNDVTLESPDIDHPGNSNSWLTIERNKISKDGKYNSSDNTITWTIEVNENHNDIAGATLKDDMFSDAISGKVDISPSTGYEKTIDGYKFVAVDNNGKNTQHYTISYKTKAGKPEESWKATPRKVTNMATLTDNGDTTTTGPVEVPIVGNTGKTTKSFVSKENTSNPNIKILNWKSTIKMPGDGVIPAGTTFDDTLIGAGQTSIYHYFTKAQLKSIYAELENKFGKGNIKFIANSYKENNAYGNDEEYSSLSDSEHYYRFRFTLLSDYKGSDVTLNYQTTADVSSIANFENTFDGHSAKYTYDAGRVTKLDGSNVGYHQNLGRVDYIPGDTNYTVDKDSSNYKNTIPWAVRVALGDKDKSVTVTDTLPKGVDWNLKSLQFGRLYDLKTATINGNTISASGEGYTASGSIEDGKITVTVSSTDGKPLKENKVLFSDPNFKLALYVLFTFDLPNETPLDEDIVKAYTNKASATVDGSPVGEDDQTQTITYKPRKKLVKSGSWDDSKHELNYSLTLNPDAQDLNANSDTYTVTDTLSYPTGGLNNISYKLLDDTVKLIDSSGNEVKDGWSWKVKEVKEVKDSALIKKSILTVVVPDNQKYTLKYVYGVSGDIVREQPYTVINTASIEGIKTGSAECTVPWETHSTSGTAKTDRSYVINKVDSNNYGKKLKDAVFAVYRYDPNNDVHRCDGDYHRYYDDEPVGYYVSDDNGRISISKTLLEAGGYWEVNIPFCGPIQIGWVNPKYNFEDNQLYYFEEIRAPEGYVLPENPDRHFFYYSPYSCIYDDEYYESVIGAVNLAKTGASIRVENKKAKRTNLTVKKEWLKSDGSKTERSDGSITYDVIQVATNQCGYSTEKVIKSGETLTHADNWTRTYLDLPVSGKDDCGNKVDYTYYVKETSSVPGYDTVYSNGSKTSDNPSDMKTDSEDGQITIKNKAQKQYELPETGGSGVKMHYVLGAALVLLTTGLIILKAYKTYQAGGDF